jgi:hypothetical protein
VHAALSVKEDSGWRQVPFALPCRTGLKLLQLDNKGEWTSKDITTLMTHAEVALRVISPAASFEVSFYQGIEGFTGWHASARLHILHAMMYRCLLIYQMPLYQTSRYVRELIYHHAWQPHTN